MIVDVGGLVPDGYDCERKYGEKCYVRYDGSQGDDPRISYYDGDDTEKHLTERGIDYVKFINVFIS